MPESAEDKSKRVFINHLTNFVWTKQVSIFYNDYGDALDAIEHSARIRKNIRRAFPDAPFLYRLCMKNVGRSFGDVIGIPESEYKNMPYHMFLTNITVDVSALSERITVWLDGADIKVERRMFTESMCHSYVETVNDDRPHNLKKFFDTEKINRFSLLNKKELVRYEG